MCFRKHCVLESLDTFSVIGTCWEDGKLEMKNSNVKTFNSFCVVPGAIFFPEASKQTAVLVLFKDKTGQGNTCFFFHLK